MAIHIESQEDLARRVEETNRHIEAIERLWPGLHRLPEKNRRNHPGIVAQVLGKPLETLFSVLAPIHKPEVRKPKQEPDEHEQVQQRLAQAFHAGLGDQDHGVDPATFEADRLLLAQRTINHQTAIADRLGLLARDFGDDALDTGALLAEVGQPALDLARSLAAANPAFRAVLAPVLDALRNMTKAARAARAKAEQPEPTEHK